MDLGIAQIGLSNSDDQRLRALLAQAVSKRVLAHYWHMSEIDEARLVIVDVGSSEGLSMISENAGNGQQVFAILAGESEEIPSECHHLPWPVRFRDLFAVLKSVESTATAFVQSGTVTGRNRQSGSSFLQLASVLRNASLDERDGSAWKIEGLPKGPLYIDPGQETFRISGSLAALRAIDPGIALQISSVPVEDIPVGAAQRPIIMLQWLVGLKAGELGLLPWLEAERILKLNRFPEFAILHHAPQHRRIAAMLSRPRQGIDALVRLTRLDTQTVTEFVNAASLCGYLTFKSGKLPALNNMSRRAGPRQALLSSFRKALGIPVING